MKKTMLTLLAFTLCSSLPIYSISAEETEIIKEEIELLTTTEDVDVTDDFKDPALRQFVVDNYGSDGRVMASDLSEVIDFSPQGLGIQDLSGIQHFTKVKYFYLVENNLGEVSLSDFPASAEEIVLHSSNVTSIDTTGGENVTSLEISNNPLSSIDLSLMPSLTIFSADDMSREFREIDFSKNPLLKYVSLLSTFIEYLDLSMAQNLKGVSISDSTISELILPETVTEEYFHMFETARTPIEHINAMPYGAMDWITFDMIPVKEVLTNEEGYPYIELHEKSVIDNLDELNADQEVFIYDEKASTLTWVGGMDAEEFVKKYDGVISFQNSIPYNTPSSYLTLYQHPLMGFYDLKISGRSFPLVDIPEKDPQTFEVKFLDCNNKIVKQEEVEEGKDATAPSGNTYDKSSILEITSDKEIKPINCSTGSSGYVVPNTGR